MDLTFLGSEMKLSEYLYRYEEMVRYVLAETSFADLQTKRIQQLFQAELRKVETAWYEFYSENHRGPDYTFLQCQITEFGVNRLVLFDQRAEGLSVDNFVYYYIELLKSEKLLSGLIFNEQDLMFIENYEQEQVRQYYEERNHYLKGYESDQISLNETMQWLGYEQLKARFLENPLIDSYRKRSTIK